MTNTRFIVRLEADNAAFDEDPRYEIARILRDIADRVENGCELNLHQNARDINGNPVGTFVLRKEEED